MNQYNEIHRSRRHSHHDTPEGLATLKQGIQYLTGKAFRPLLRFYYFLWYASKKPRDGRRIAGSWFFHNIFTFCNLLVLIWCWILLWGEVRVFDKSIAACHWAAWERWPLTATPHHLAFVADPQLVDPHTYPGRPWPLSTLTVKHTDIYLRRSYSRLQRQLRPDTIFFLGDLFDGGREWSTSVSQSKEEQYWKYGEEFWHREHDRFSGIFLRDWSDGVNQPQIIASLPGNHDLGFGAGIKEPVRARFNAFFGESNRVDVIGNHTFVSLDSVSLSAKDEPNPQDSAAIWRPSEDFLDNAETKIAAAVDRHLNLTEKNKPQRYKHVVVELNDQSYINHHDPVHSSAHDSFPVILLTHVPLYRPHGTPCGPLRERYPPIPPPPGETKPVEPDEKNAISISHGDQYQNVLSRDISVSISERLGNSIEYAFSGDDHDYCELVHKTYPSKKGSNSGIREITVKSISWAMGVRKPGFVMVSMFNPVDGSGTRILQGRDNLHNQDDDQDASRTLQTHLCLLPDQLSIFIRYALFFGVSVLLLLLRAIGVTFFPAKFSAPTTTLSVPLLPIFTSRAQSKRRGSRSISHDNSSDKNKQSTFVSLHRGHASLDDFTRAGQRSRPQTAENSFTSVVPSSATSASLSVHSTSAKQAQLARGRSPMPTRGYGYGVGTHTATQSNEPLVTETSNDEVRNEREYGERDHYARTRAEKDDRSLISRCCREWTFGLWQVARIVFPWYAWLLWR